MLRPRRLIASVLLASFAGGAAAATSPTLAETIGRQIADMVAHGEPAGRIEARWERMLADLDEKGVLEALLTLVEEGSGPSLDEIERLLRGLEERQTADRAAALARLARSGKAAQERQLIVIETGISELTEELRDLERELGEHPVLAELTAERRRLENLGRTARDLRRSARRHLQE